MKNQSPADIISTLVFILLLIGSIVVFMLLFIFSSPEYSLFLIAALFIVILMIAKTEYMALAMVVSCIITRFPGVTTYLTQYKTSFFSAVILGWFLKKLLYSQVDRSHRFQNNVLATPILLFTFLLLISFFSSADKGISGQYLLAHLLCFGSLFMFYDLCKDRRFRSKVMVCIFLMAFFTSIVAILQYLVEQFNIFLFLEKYIIPELNRRDFVVESDFVLLGFRSMGTLSHPNLLGMFLAMVFPLAFTLTAYSQKKIEKSMFFLLLIISGIAVFCSNSRGSILNIIVGLSLIMILDIKKSYKTFLILLFSSIFLCLFFKKEIVEYLRVEDVLSFRDVIWSNSTAMFLEKPFLGHGIGRFSIEYLGRYGLGSLYTATEAVRYFTFYGGVIADSSKFIWAGILTAHNLFLHYAVEVGLLGPIFLLWFYTVFFKWAIVNRYRANDGYSKSIILGLTAVYLGNFVHNFFEATAVFNEISVGIPFMVITAVAFAAIPPDKE